MVLFLASLILLVAHLTGNLKALNVWFDFQPTQWLFILILPLVFVLAIVLLRDDAG
jgi:hypothetical protein